MNGIEIAGYALVLASMAYFYWWLNIRKARELRKVCDADKSRLIEVAASGSLFVPQFDQHVSSGSEVYIPSGDGLYSTRHKPSRNRDYRNGIVGWLKRGAVVHIIISQPSEDAIRHWRSIKSEFPKSLFVHLLDRNTAAGNNTSNLIRQLDTFHTSVLLNPPGSKSYPGALWIEPYHPLGSKYAYNVEYVSPRDAANDGRLEKYAMLYRNLLTGPHVTDLEASNPLSRAKVNTSLAA